MTATCKNKLRIQLSSITRYRLSCENSGIKTLNKWIGDPI